MSKGGDICKRVRPYLKWLIGILLIMNTIAIGILLIEEGKISKESVIALGSMFVGSVALAGAAEAAYNCGLSFTPPSTEVATCVHTSTATPASCGGGGMGCGGCGMECGSGGGGGGCC